MSYTSCYTYMKVYCTVYAHMKVYCVVYAHMKVYCTVQYVYIRAKYFGY